MPKIITVTANTAIDHVIAVDDFALGDTIIAHHSIEFAAGKGINVAKAIASLQHPVIALGFVGQQSRPIFEALNSTLLQTDLTLVNGKTRNNITLATANGAQETHIRTAGYTVTAADCQQLMAKIKAYAQAGDIIILSGSLPAGAPTDFYKSLIEQCHALGALAFLDSSGEPLKAAISARPDLLKPNLHELEALTGKILPDEPSIIQAAQALIAQGIPCVVVSRGSKGALLVTANEVLAAAVTNAPEQITSTIGCGDAMLAGLALATLQGDDLKTTLTLAVACGTANLVNAEPGKFDQPLLADIHIQVVVK